MLALRVMPGGRVRVAFVPVTVASPALKVMVPVPKMVCVPLKMSVAPHPSVLVAIEPPGPKVSPPVTVRLEQLVVLMAKGALRVTALKMTLAGLCEALAVGGVEGGAVEGEGTEGEGSEGGVGGEGGPGEGAAEGEGAAGAVDGAEGAVGAADGEAAAVDGEGAAVGPCGGGEVDGAGSSGHLQGGARCVGESAGGDADGSAAGGLDDALVGEVADAAEVECASPQRWPAWSPG